MANDEINPARMMEHDGTKTRDPHDGTLTKTRDPHDGTLSKTRDPHDGTLSKTRDPPDGTLSKTWDPHDGTLTKTQDPQCLHEPPWGHSWMCRKRKRPEDPEAQCLSAFEHRSDFPGGPWAGPPRSQCRGPRLHPRSGN